MTRPGYHATPRDQWVADEVERANRHASRVDDLTVDRTPGIVAALDYARRNAEAAERRADMLDAVLSAIAGGLIVAGLIMLAVGFGL